MMSDSFTFKRNLTLKISWTFNRIVELKKIQLTEVIEKKNLGFSIVVTL